MIIATDYEVEEGPGGMLAIHNHSAPTCPECGALMSGYDRRRRGVISGSGEKVVFLLRRLWCRECGNLHLELPDIVQPGKRYEAQLVADTISGVSNHCPADDSTIRRWKAQHAQINPPALPVSSAPCLVCSTSTDK